MASENHVLVKVARIDERSRQPRLADIVIDMVLSWQTLVSTVEIPFAFCLRHTFIDPRDQLTSRQFRRTRQGAPYETLNSSLKGSFD